MISHVLAVDDAPFARSHRGDVLVVGVVYAGLTLHGVLSTRVRRDGANATRALEALVTGSPFVAHLQAVLLKGIALAGFNVVDIQALAATLQRPVIVVARRAPDLPAMRAALLQRVPGGVRKWRLIEKAGPMEPLPPPGPRLHVQRAGIDLADAAALLRRLTVHGHIPEPLRVAHLVAGGVARGYSTGRA